MRAIVIKYNEANVRAIAQVSGRRTAGCCWSRFFILIDTCECKTWLMRVCVCWSKSVQSLFAISWRWWWCGRWRGFFLLFWWMPSSGGGIGKIIIEYFIEGHIICKWLMMKSAFIFYIYFFFWRCGKWKVDVCDHFVFITNYDMFYNAGNDYKLVCCWWFICGAGKSMK